MVLPDGEKLRTLERLSRTQGSGVQRTDVLGNWQLRQIWPRTSEQPSRASGILLRSLRAHLHIADAEDGPDLSLCNSISIAGFRLAFTGPGRLCQKRPLLMFHFLRLQISLAETVLFTRALAEPSRQQEPFFALIGRGSMESGSAWLAARGRGGGLALWVQEDGPTAS